jgi:putative ABC transport system permease protein
MLVNYLKIALRTLLKFKGYATINLLGLALGITSGVLILVYVLDELSFDRFHTQGDRIYRVGTDMRDIKTGDLNGGIEGNGWPIGKILEKDFPEVERVTYIRNALNIPINHQGKRMEERMFFADHEFLRMFSYPLASGDSLTALSEPYTIVISERLALKYFGNESPLGKQMTLADSLTMVVTGVMKDVPSQSHMQFEALLSFKTYEVLNPDFNFDDGWGNLNVRNYVLLKDGVDHQAFFKKANSIYMDHVGEEMKQWGMYMYAGFEPLFDIYLKTTRGNGMGPLGSIDRVYMVAGIAVFVILLACINFINLATARSVYRAKEVGLRKVVGSTRHALIRQFLSESFVLTLLAFFISLALIGVLLPLFNQLVGKNYTLNILTQPWVMLGITALIAMIALLAGYYPAVVMSRLRPTEVLKGKMQSSSRGIQLRRVLVVFQFVISVGLIITTLVVVDQLNFMKNGDLGFSGDQIIVLDVSKVPSNASNKFGASTNGVAGAYEVIKNELRALPQVEQVSFTNAVPGKPGWVGQWAHAEDRTSEESTSVEYMTIDEDYLATLGLKLVAGHNFDRNNTGELEDGLIINETTARVMGWGTAENAIGKKIQSPSQHPAGTVIGVVKDYHEFGLQREIYPMAMDFKPTFSRYFAVRYNASATSDMLVSLEKLWKKYYSEYDFNYFFLDDNFERQYQAEQRLVKVFTVFTFITVLIASIGLIGLVSFMVVARTKEIGIRKILGADVLSVMSLLSKEFIVLVVIANIITAPIAWYYANQWLEGFAYRTTLGAGLFIVTFAVAIGITLLTVSIQTARAAMANPVKSLRYE